MKILFFAHSLRKGGAERLLLQIASHLNKNGHDIKILQVIDFDEYPEGEYADIKKEALLKVHEYKWPYVFPQLVSKFKFVVKDYQPDLICAFSPIVVIISAFSGIKIKLIHVVQGYGSVIRDRTLKQGIYKLLDKISMYLLDYDVIVPTKSLKNAFLAYLKVDESKVEVVVSGVDSKNLQPINKFHFNKKINITMLGTIYRQKRQRDAIEVVKEFKTLNPNLDISVSIIGAGSDEIYIKEKIINSGLEDSISLLGRRDDAFELIANSHIFWHLSESEGMPLVIMEAMALGIPTIGYNVRGVNDVIEHGINGYLAEFKDMKAIASYTNNLILDIDKYEKFRVNARSTIDQKYNIEGMLTNYENHLMKKIKK